jgi:hypothetical protein
MKVLSEKKSGERQVLTSFSHKGAGTVCNLYWKIRLNGRTEVWHGETEASAMKKSPVYTAYPHWKTRA